MKGKRSYSYLEKEFWPEMRNRINNSENKMDLMNHFSYTVVNLLEKAFEKEEIELKTDDVLFDPEEKNYFKISNTLNKQQIFISAWEDSDLPNVIGRFAESTYHRYLHVCKHPEKTELKIRSK